MEFLKKNTLLLVDLVFQHHTPRQKRESVQFLHGLIVLILLFIFVYAPSCSYIRKTVFFVYISFMVLYFILGDCWVSQVENELTKESNSGVLDNILSIIGIPKNKHTRAIITGISYLYAIFLMSCLMFRDLFGTY
jgi:hypothetical protein